MHPKSRRSQHYTITNWTLISVKHLTRWFREKTCNLVIQHSPIFFFKWKICECEFILLSNELQLICFNLANWIKRLFSIPSSKCCRRTHIIWILLNEISLTLFYPKNAFAITTILRWFENIEVKPHSLSFEVLFFSYNTCCSNILPTIARFDIFIL